MTTSVAALNTSFVSVPPLNQPSSQDNGCPCPSPANPPAAELLSNYAPPASKTLTFTISSFPFNQTALGDEGRRQLDEIVTAARGMNDYSITIVGHADAQTLSESANWAVSRNRANTAKDYLVSQRLISANIYTEGMGATKPIASNGTAEGRAQNRRVEIKLVGTPKG